MLRSHWRTGSIAAGAVLLGETLVLVLLGNRTPGPLLTLPVVMLLLLGLHYHSQWSGGARAGFGVLAAVAAIVFSMSTFDVVLQNLRHLPEWDFLGFWLHARTAVLGQSFYDPASAQALAAPFDVSPLFRREIVATGFWYPPPSMFLFWPLGWFESPSSALPFWYVLQVTAAALVVGLAWRIFFPKKGAVELIVCAALVCVGFGTYATFHFSQTNFIALLAVLLFWLRRDTVGGGAWVPVAAFAKPLLAVLAVPVLLGRSRRAIAGMALCGGALTLASVFAFGPGTFAEYFTRSLAGAKPSWIYFQPTNGSLLGLVLRGGGTECDGRECATNPLYLAGAAVVGVLTVLLGVGLQRIREAEWALSLWMLLALIVYPVSQMFYSVLLLPLVLLLWRRREDLAGGPWTVSALIGTVYVLTAVDRGAETALGFLLLWIAMAAIGARLVQGAGWPLRPAGSHGVHG